MKLLMYVLLGLVVGALFGVFLQCVRAWYEGGSPDPRCAYGLKGYVERHTLGQTRRLDRVSCQYRPEVGR